MIYDPITRQQVELLGKYPTQDSIRFVKARYGEHVAQWAKDRGGFPVGTERDVDLNSLVADDGSKEIHQRYEQLPLIEE